VVRVTGRLVERGDPAHTVELTVTITDTGIGIPADKVDRLFRSFSQVDASTTRQFGGTGLGLAISKRLVEMMRGQIWVESEVGVGSEFGFTILAETAPWERPKFLQEDQPLLHDKRVLIVDDNQTNRKILTLQTESWGMKPTVVESGAAALEALSLARDIDVAILDMHMPGMDGLELARAIRGQEGLAGMSLVMLTSLGPRGQDARDDIFDAFLTKPLKASALYNVILELIVGHSLEDRTTQGTELPELREDLPPLRILVAEDNVINQKVALLTLERLGYRADMVSNGIEVLEALRRQWYDVILMDVQMPEMDGIEATAHVRSEFSEDEQPRIIAMTANAMEGDKERCLEAGMDDYVGKPFRMHELAAVLRKCEPGDPTDPSLSIDTGGADGLLPIDRAMLNGLIDSLGPGAKDIIPSLLDSFCTDAQELIDAAHEALKKGEHIELRRAAHTLKSTSATVGAMILSQASRDLEVVAKDGDLHRAAYLITALEHSFAAAQAALMRIKEDL